jgi:hypothetical protein
MYSLWEFPFYKIFDAVCKFPVVGMKRFLDYRFDTA